MLVNVFFQNKKLTLDRGENELVLAAFLKNFDEDPFLSGSTSQVHNSIQTWAVDTFWSQLVHILGKFQIINLHYFNVRWLLFGAFDIRLTFLCIWRMTDSHMYCGSHTNAPLGPSPHTVAPRETKLH